MSNMYYDAVFIFVRPTESLADSLATSGNKSNLAIQTESTQDPIVQESLTGSDFANKLLSLLYFPRCIAAACVSQ